MNLDLNTIHLFHVGYGMPGRCTGSESFYAKNYKEARAKANCRCARFEQVITLEKVEQRKTSKFPLVDQLLNENH
jgi:hypothetical protein